MSARVRLSCHLFISASAFSSSGLIRLLRVEHGFAVCFNPLGLVLSRGYGNEATIYAPIDTLQERERERERERESERERERERYIYIWSAPPP